MSTNIYLKRKVPRMDSVYDETHVCMPIERSEVGRWKYGLCR